ncbi:hypothetical protein B0H21DRAFT_788725 [Amylocystis lapponica]|nr:hypothetical protein B0H21DRAFT_788725 [Amylocystis lapponica]
MSPASAYYRSPDSDEPLLHVLRQAPEAPTTISVASPSTLIVSSSIATVHPTPTVHSGGSGIPEIGGSSAGFIALVVVLSLIIVVCFVAVFFLLRNHSPTTHERRARQAYAREHESLYELPVGPPGIRSKFARFFGRKEGKGWVRAASGDGDEWDAADDRSAYKDRDLREESIPQSSFYVARQLSKMPHAMSTDSVEVELEAASASSPPRDAVSPRPSLVSLSSTTPHDPFSSSPTSIAHSLPDTEDGSTREEGGRFSVQSGEPGRTRSMRKFENGTKFREGLDF